MFKKNSIEDLYKMFSIKRRGNQIIFFNYSSIYNTYFVFIFIEHTYIKEEMEQIGFVVGMGKSRNFFSAYQGGLNEAKLVENVLQKVIEQGKVYSVNGVLRKEVNKYLDIFYNNKLFEILNDKDSEIKINDNIVSNDSYNTIDLSEYVPTFLKKFNRLVYYTSEYKIINEIKKVI